MTFRTRNTFLVTLLIFSVSLLFIYTALVLFSFFENNISLKTFSEDIFPHIIFAKYYKPWAVIFSIFVFLIYVPICVFFIFFEFEKTHSTEVIFFAFFLIGCLCESVRLWIPLLNLWQSFSLVSIFTGRAILFGRILSPMSLLFLVVFSHSEQRQFVERNIIVLLVISITSAIIFPLNTMVTLPSFCMQCGDEKLFFTIRILVLILASLSMFVKTKLNENILNDAVYFSILELGYFLCCSSFSFVMLIISSTFFIVGTISYLSLLHKKYLWK